MTIQELKKEIERSLVGFSLDYRMSVSIDPENGDEGINLTFAVPNFSYKEDELQLIEDYDEKVTERLKELYRNSSTPICTFFERAE